MSNYKLNDILYYGDEARDKLKSGINKVADAVKLTMGPGGRTVILGDPGGLPMVTKDGVTVAKYIKLIDPIENMGAQLLKQASSKTVDDAGDGTTTATVIAQSIINYDKDIDNVTQFRRGMEAARDETIAYLDLNKKECEDKDLYNIALTSANGDDEIAETVADVASKVGKFGTIEVRPTEFNTTSVSIEDGYRMDRGLPNSYFVNNPDTGLCDLDGDGFVICIEDKIEHLKTIVPMITRAHRENKFLIIIAKEFSPEVIKGCQQNFTLNTPIRVVPIVAPEFGDQMLVQLEDIALYCDTKVISEAELRAGEGRLGLINSARIGRDFTNLKSDTAPGRVVTKIKQLNSAQYDIPFLAILWFSESCLILILNSTCRSLVVRSTKITL